MGQLILMQLFILNVLYSQLNRIFFLSRSGDFYSFPLSQGRLEKVKQKVLPFSVEGILYLFASVNVTYAFSSKGQYSGSGS